jgi:hypothetical protein
MHLSLRDAEAPAKEFDQLMSGCGRADLVAFAGGAVQAGSHLPCGCWRGITRTATCGARRFKVRQMIV